MLPYVHCSTIYNSQDLEPAEVSITRQVDKTTMENLHNEYYSVVKKEKILPFETA